jgi:protein phosphatase
MGAFLSQPLTSKILQRKGNEQFRVGAAIMQGWRESMEDAHTIELQLDKHKDTAFFGVFDGHCGKLASKFCSENMHKYIDSINDEITQQNITDKIFELDKSFMDSNLVEDGTTAIFSLVRPGQNGMKEVIVGNIGDSRAVLGQASKTALGLSEDHKPNNAIEQKRIEKAGGFVSLNRVRGNLALSRAIGDRSYKIPTDFPPKDQQVTCDPEYKSVPITDQDFLFLGCDGIYEGDIFTVESVIQYISEKLEKTDDLAQVCADLLEECLQRGSKDNMSAMIVQFKDGRDYDRADEYCPGPFHEGPRHQEFQEAYQSFAKSYGNLSIEESRKLFETIQKNKANSVTSPETNKETN